MCLQRHHVAVMVTATIVLARGLHYCQERLVFYYCCIFEQNF